MTLLVWAVLIVLVIIIPAVIVVLCNRRTR